MWTALIQSLKDDRLFEDAKAVPQIVLIKSERGWSPFLKQLCSYIEPVFSPSCFSGCVVGEAACCK